MHMIEVYPGWCKVGYMWKQTAFGGADSREFFILTSGFENIKIEVWSREKGS